jgi:hypothetical protein
MYLFTFLTLQTIHVVGTCTLTFVFMVEVAWVVMLCGVVAVSAFHRTLQPPSQCHPEDGSSKVL